MIRAYGQGKDRPLVILGLDRQNLARLTDGQPIVVNLRDLNPEGPPVEELPDVDVVICFAGTDEINMLLAKMSIQ